MLARYPVPLRILRDLEAVEAELVKVATSADGALRDACLWTLEAGGKRLRPALVLVGGTAGSYDLEALMPHAVAVELVHMASLVHDDILDDAPSRRGRPSVHSKWDRTIGMATGDFLFAKSFEIASRSGVHKAPEILSATALDLTVGELMQRESAGRVDVTREDYVKRITAKTASLFRVSCLLGALASGADEERADALAVYGENLGIAFQIYDDVLDVSGKTDVLGKQVGTDLRDGTITLPMMIAVERLGDDKWLRDAFSLGREDRGKIDEALEVLTSTDAVARAKDIARTYITAAVDAVDGIGRRRLQRTLADIGNYVVARYD